jgi:glutathione S-transferase
MKAMAMLTLYDYELSAECYAVRLLLSFLDVKHQSVAVDVYPGRANETSAFRTKSPLARMPVLEDDASTLWDWQAILVYLAERYDSGGAWFPSNDRARAALIMQWLSVARDMQATAGLARLHEAMFVDADIEACRIKAHDLMRYLDEHLWFQEQSGQQWILDGTSPTLADLAPFPAVMLSEEGGVDRRNYPAVRRWCDRFKRTPGFIGMSGVFPAAATA